LLATWGAYHERARRNPAAPQAKISSTPVAPHELRPVAKAESESSSYFEITVVPKQTITDISTQNLGSFNGSVLHDIKALNPNLSDPDHIEVGQTLRLPKRSNAPVATRQN
jgi:nucleoid-associated protein YgaU